MMNINIKHSLATGLMCCGMAALLTACADWDDHYAGTDTTGGGNLTLWETLQTNEQLSDFCEVLEQTKVFRMHKKTSVSYADLLGSGQAFTVVAPLNGTFDKDSLLRLVQTNQGDSIVEKFFVKNHLSRTLNSITPEKHSMLMLNAKHIDLEGNSIEGSEVSQANCHAKNGILHVVNEPLPYRYSLYEALCDIPELSSIGQVLRLYNEDYFDADASVSSGIVEGVPVYIDSVVIERNRLLQEVGLIASEDSTYWMVVPTTEGWQKAWQEAESHFHYSEKVARRDSLQQHWTTRALLEDAIFNMTDQKSVNDSLISVPYNRLEPKYHVFYKPFEDGGILSQATPMECSNGVLYQTDGWAFTPKQTYFKELWTEAEHQNLITSIPEDDGCNVYYRELAADSVSKGAYLEIANKNLTDWEITFRVDNTLSGNYDVCAIVLPKSVKDQDDPDLRPNLFTAAISYINEKGEKVKVEGGTQFTNNPERVDTIVLAHDFHFPVCSYDQSAVTVEVTLMTDLGRGEDPDYSRVMYLDCIYLRPRTSNSEEQ